MNTWNMPNSCGISIGGEFYQSDADGSVTVPDNCGDLTIYGFTPVASKADIKAQAKIDAAAQAGAESAQAANAEVSAAITAATKEAEAKPQTTSDAAEAAAAALATTVVDAAPVDAEKTVEAQ